MNRSILDTGTLSYYLKGHSLVVARAAGYLAAFGKMDFSVVSYYEVRRGLLHAQATRKLARLDAFVAVSNLWDLDRQSAAEAARVCADLWHAGTPLDDADLLIAGIALAHGLVLITNNSITSSAYQACVWRTGQRRHRTGVPQWSKACAESAQV